MIKFLQLTIVNLQMMYVDLFLVDPQFLFFDSCELTNLWTRLTLLHLLNFTEIQTARKDNWSHLHLESLRSRALHLNKTL
jgi:hypothetical protein